jgi:imidazoleglycerol-phosphate dehydratase
MTITDAPAARNPSIVERKTRETTVRVHVGSRPGADGSRASIRTGEPFLDHMLQTLSHYGALALEIEASGDMRHHLIEDVAIAIGTAIAGSRGASIARYGERTVPMDDALVQVAIDLGGRPYYAGPLPSGLYDHWMRSFADHARATLHVRVIRGHDRHHIVEAAFKALGFALQQALVATVEPISTKGSVEW